MAMDIFGLGNLTNKCFACNSFYCHHIMGAQQQMSGRALQDHYNHMLGMSQAQAQAQDITRGFVATPPIEPTKPTKPKPNIKLLLLKR